MTGNDGKFDTGSLTGSEVLGMLTGSGEDLSPRRWPQVSRPCYDKFHRCPGWAGGGLRYARVRRCDSGYIAYYTDDGLLPWWRWRTYRCPKCRVLVLPYATRYADPSWLRYRATRACRDLAYEARLWQDRAREGFPAEDDPSYWQQRWPLPVRAALFPLGYAAGTLGWLATDLADRLLPGSADAWEHWYNRQARRHNRKANAEAAGKGEEGGNGDQVQLEKEQ